MAQAACQRFAQLDQAKPLEVDKHVAILELLSEKVLAAMEEKENEAKRARTVRYEYHRDVEQVQTWICQAEGRVQDRNLEPQTLKEFLQVWNFPISNSLSPDDTIRSNYFFTFADVNTVIWSMVFTGIAMRNWVNHRSNGSGLSTRNAHLSADEGRTRATVGSYHLVQLERPAAASSFLARREETSSK